MNTTATFIRLFFVLISALFFCAYTTTVLEGGFSPANIGIGILAGIIVTGLLIGFERMIKKFDLYAFNIVWIGLFFGYLMGQAIVLILSTILQFGQVGPEVIGFSLMKVIVYLVTTYFGVMITLRSSEELHLSIPFIKFQAAVQKKKDMVLDLSAVLDTRLIDLAASGLLDNQIIVPRFLLKELYSNLESIDDGLKANARRALDVLKKLEGITTLGMRYVETDFPEIADLDAKCTRLARLTNANIVTADQNRIKQSTIESTEGVRIINIHALANSLKPLNQSGETLEIKIQRYGKEPGQGVGYLEDGTMVVVNGGAEYIGKTIKSHVLSVKHTSSGRMIFCNAFDEYEDEETMPTSSETPARSYFALER
ncbi:MAG: putative PIN and TRAM-domain containing protein YacL [Chlamydiae bacterium]|nr:putative PIN and TRAM-domain containing protein YacL [Chlamydiota bacterium]